MDVGCLYLPVRFTHSSTPFALLCAQIPAGICIVFEGQLARATSESLCPLQPKTLNGGFHKGHAYMRMGSQPYQNVVVMCRGGLQDGYVSFFTEFPVLEFYPSKGDEAVRSLGQIWLLLCTLLCLLPELMVVCCSFPSSFLTYHSSRRTLIKFQYIASDRARSI